ncbi:MAG: biotin transporter BioY, partial [Chloroflexota bacterium]
MITGAHRAERRTLLDAALPYAGPVTDVVLVVAASLIIAAAAQVRIPPPFTPVPVTGQTFAVLLLGASLGARRGAAATLLYLLEGWAGLPFFSGGVAGAFWTIAAGGYILGFIPAAFIVGALAVFVLPRLNPEGFDRYGFRQELLSAARYAQKTAMASGCEVQLAVSAGADSVTLNYRTGGTDAD